MHCQVNRYIPLFPPRLGRSPPIFKGPRNLPPPRRRLHAGDAPCTLYDWQGLQVMSTTQSSATWSSRYSASLRSICSTVATPEGYKPLIGKPGVLCRRVELRLQPTLPLPLISVGTARSHRSINRHFELGTSTVSCLFGERGSCYIVNHISM